MKKTIASIILSAVIVTSLFTGCAPVKETTAETEPPVVWADEQGIVTTDKREFDKKGFPYYMNDDRTEHSDVYFPISADMHYKFISVEASEPDKYGQVSYTVKYEYDNYLCCDDAVSEAAGDEGFTKANVQVLFFGVVDSNTGIVPNRDDVYHNGGSLKLTQIEWGGKKFSVGWEMKNNNDWEDWVTTVNDDGTSTSSIVYHRAVTMTVVAPEGYDGLYLYITKNDDTEYDDNRYKEITEHQWGSEEGDVSDYYFIRLTDLV